MLVADYILKKREYVEYPLDLEQPREGCGQKGDGHDRYHQDDEELSLTHSFLFSRSSLPANTEVLVLSSKRVRSLLGRSHLATREADSPGGAAENLLIRGAERGGPGIPTWFRQDEALAERLGTLRPEGGFGNFSAQKPSERKVVPLHGSSDQGK
jgi:hypothetical protein